MRNRTAAKVVGAWLVALCVAALGVGCDSTVEDGGGGEDECTGFDDEAGTPVTVRFTNAGTAPMYVGTQNGCGGLNAFTLSAVGSSEVVPWYRGACNFTCEELREITGDCAADCAIPPVYRVEPGGHYDIAWDGLVLVERDMPAACFAEPSFAGPCQQEVAASGSYQVTGQVFAAVEGCDPMTGACDCQPNAEGWCQMDWSAMPSGNAVTAEATVTLPAANLVEVVFE